MLRIFRKSFWIPCEDFIACPSLADTHTAIAKFCDENGYSYDFTQDDEVVIGGIAHEIICVRSVFFRGRYVIKCREK